MPRIRLDRVPVPPRVVFALEALKQFMWKETPAAVPHPMGIEVLEKTPISPAEAVARDACADTIEAYVSGRMKMDAWEGVDFVRLAPATAEKPEEPDDELYQSQPCPQCSQNGKVSTACKLCEGCGEITIVPKSLMS